MVTKFESLPYELIMVIVEFIDNPLSIFLNLNSNINKILFDHRIKLSSIVEDIHLVIPLQTNLTRLVLMNFKDENLQKFRNLKSLTLFIDENIINNLKLPLSLIYLKINFNIDISPSLFNSLLTLKQLNTLIMSNKRQSNIIFPLDSIVVHSIHIKMLQLKDISATISSLYHCEKLTKLKYLELKLIRTSGPFDYMSFTFPYLLKTLIIQFELSFEDLEYVLDSCCGDNLKHLELHSRTCTSQPDYFDSKRWCKLLERFQNLIKCQIQLQQKGSRGIYWRRCREFARELETIKELKTKWNMKCYSSCPGYHGYVVSVNISANL